MTQGTASVWPALSYGAWAATCETLHAHTQIWGSSLSSSPPLSPSSEQIEIGWWPGHREYDRAAFFAFAHPAPDGFADADLSPEAARWDPDLGEFVLDWEDVRAEEDPASLALAFSHSAFGHACEVCGWDSALADSRVGSLPPIR